MYKNVILFVITSVLSIWSLCSTISEWDSSESLQLESISYTFLSLFTSFVAAVSTAIFVFLSVHYLKMRPSEAVGESSVIYQAWLSLVFARSCLFGSLL